MAETTSTLPKPGSAVPAKPANKPKLPRAISLKIDTSNIPSVISIFGVEHFKLDACLAKNIESKNTICAGNAKPDEPGSLEEAIDAGNAAAPKEANANAAAAAAAGAAEAAAAGAGAAAADDSLDEISGHLGPNTVVSQNSQSYVYKTRKEFEHLYLPGHLEKQDKKLMLKVFRFVFGKSEGSIDRDFLSKLLTPFNKLPCKQGSQVKLWEMFKECIEYRINGSVSNANADADAEPNAKAEAEPNAKAEAEVEPEAKAEAEPKAEPKAEPEPKANAKPKAESMGLNNELNSLQKILPKENQEYANKQYLRAQLIRTVHLLNEHGKTCVVFSDTGANLNLSEYHTAILDLLRKTITSLLTNPLPENDEKKDFAFLQLIGDLKGLKPTKGDNREIYDNMLAVVKGIFDKASSIDDSISGLGDVQHKLEELIAKLLPKPAQTGGGTAAAEAAAADAEEEYERVFTTAMEHAKGSILDDVCEVLGGTDLDSSIEHAVSEKGFDLHATMSRLHELNTEGNKHAKSFLRCVETLLEIKQDQYNTYKPPPPLAPGKERYLQTMAEYPSLEEYIPKNILKRGDLATVRKKLRRIYPYADTLIEDISEIRKSPDPCCLFYKATLVKGRKAEKLRRSCKRILEQIPNCERLLEELLVLGSSQSVVAKKLRFTEVSLPKGFSLLAEAIRDVGVLRDVPSLPITIHEVSPPEFQEVLGESPFLLVGSGTTMTGIKGYEIDVSDDIEAIRKGEISIGTIMFLYLYIKCDSDVDV
jgi:hypothetical protein